jgi:hypothetical protein
MAVPLNDGKTKRHDARKNPRSAELWHERKRAANAARPKQDRVTREDGTILGPVRE